MESSQPHIDSLSPLLDTAPEDNHETLPAYYAPASTTKIPSSLITEHSYELADGNLGCSVKLSSRATLSSTTANPCPLYINGDPISGTVELNLKEQKTIPSITLRLRCEIMTPDRCKSDIWNETYAIYTSTSKAGLGMGQHTFPFTYNLPFTVSSKRRSRKGKEKEDINFELPPSHTSPKSHISYEMKVVVDRGKFHANVSITVPWIYIPRSRASRPSEGRLLALQGLTTSFESCGPNEDPVGWETLPEVVMKGEMFGGVRQAEVTCQLSIARPLQVARGCVLPLYLVLTSNDAQALDLLTKPSVPLIGLVQLETWHPEYDHANRELHTKESIAKATWWALPPVTGEGDKRTLEGEIRVPSTLTPSFEFAGSEMKYSVYLFPPRPVSGFTLQSPINAPLVEQTVQVVTDPPHGLPTQSSFAPPRYDGEEVQDESEELTEMKMHLMFSRIACHV